MRKLLLSSLLLFSTNILFSQYLQLPSPSEINASPEWAKEMYSASPNAWHVDADFSKWMNENPGAKTYHTQYYKRWRKMISDYILADGTIQLPTIETANETARMMREKKLDQMPMMGVGNWTLVGPNHVNSDATNRKAEQTNVYSIDRCEGNNSVLYCGTETALIFKSTDGGNNWNCVSNNYDISSITAIEIDPVNPDIAFAGGGSVVWKTTDGGSTWNQSLTASGLNPNEILVHPLNRQIVMVAADKGFYRTTDGGANWTQVYTDDCFDVKFNTQNNETIYLLKDSPANLRCEFFISSDTGATFTIQTTGWFNGTDPDRYNGGARMATSLSDPNRIYVHLIGQAKNGDDGFIGVYKSTDGGLSWSLPNGPDGGPYTVAHPNLAVGSPTWHYNQGFYNCAIMCSPTDPDKILVGGLNLWRSDDGGMNYDSVAGYVGGPLNMHVDNQDFRSFGNEQWLSCDGGIYRSTDFFTTQPEVKMDGVHGSDYWGFGSGWNEDVLVGGLYHNGNLAWYENFADGEFLSLGGGEAPTGYVNPGENRRTYFSDIGGRLLPQNLGDPVPGIPFSLSPNESYGAAESSELEFHPHCYNIAYLGRDHKLWKTTDGCLSFSLVDSFNISPNAKIQQIEISRSNPDVMYISQRPSTGSTGWIRKTTDAGSTWNTVSLPAGISDRSRILLALSADDENTLWIAFPGGGNGTKIYKTTNSGTNWTNITTSVFDGENIHSIIAAGGTDGGIYAFTNWGAWYRDITLGSWVQFNSGLPLRFPTDIAKPFYRDGKVRVASYGKGIWESSFYTAPSRPIATATVDKWTTICTNDTFYFEDYSMLNHNNATWSWTFQNGTPSTSSLRNPKVVFNSIGTFQVTLTVTDALGNSDSDTISVSVTGTATNTIAENFETIFLPAEWLGVTGGNLSWSQTSLAGGFGNSYKSAIADNYNADAGGTWCDMRAPVNFQIVTNPKLTFDVAYTPWGGSYTDTLEVKVSSDCGASWNLLYRKGDMDLSTAGAPLNSGMFVPNSTQWRTDTVDLSAYSNQSLVMIAFRNWGHFGQALYLDNINITGTLTGIQNHQTDNSYAQLFPNPVTSDGYLNFLSSDAGKFNLKMYDMNGKLILHRDIHSGDKISLGELGLADGVYGYSLEGNSVMKYGKVVVGTR